jgi:hypothetical protein
MDYIQEVKIKFSFQLQTSQVFKKELTIPALKYITLTYSGIKIYNTLPSNILNLKNDRKQFKTELYKYLLNNSFYCQRIFGVQQR